MYFPDWVYDKSIDYISVSYAKGITENLKDKGFYKLLTPNLKHQLTMEALEKYHDRFYYFFHDVESKNNADPAFIRKVLSNLDCQM